MENGTLFIVFNTINVIEHYSLTTSGIEYLIPFTIGAMTLTILFDAQIGFMAIASVAILMGLMMGQGIDLIIVSLFSSAAIYNIRRLRKESTFSAMFLSLLLIFVAIGLSLFRIIPEIIFEMFSFLRYYILAQFSLER